MATLEEAVHFSHMSVTWKPSNYPNNSNKYKRGLETYEQGSKSFMGRLTIFTFPASQLHAVAAWPVGPTCCCIYPLSRNDRIAWRVVHTNLCKRKKFSKHAH